MTGASCQIVIQFWLWDNSISNWSIPQGNSCWCPIGNIYHVIRVEFLVRASLCVCCFLCVLNAPALNADSKEEYFLFFFFCKIVYPYLPKKHKHSQLHDLVNLCRFHRHSNSYLNPFKVFFYPSRDDINQVNFIFVVYVNIFDRAQNWRKRQ